MTTRDEGSAPTIGSLCLVGWNDRPVKAWQDADGDIGIIDDIGYSIILHQRSVARLVQWLGCMCWIPVSERLPDAGKSVLVVDVAFSREPFIAWVGDRGQWECSGGIIIPPTHWMPLPIGPVPP